MINPHYFLKALLSHGGSWNRDPIDLKEHKSQPSEVAHLSKRELKRRRRIRRLSRRKR